MAKKYLLGFYVGMNILPIQFTPQKNSLPTFSARKTPIKKIAQSTSDVVEITSKNNQPLPPKMELTEIEQKFNEVFMTLRRLNSNIHTQKQMLHSYYSPKDKYDYQELLKTRRNIMNKLERMAKTYEVGIFETETLIDIKKTYNRYAPKILKCKTTEDFQNIEELISTNITYPCEKELLYELIAQRMKEL